MKNILYIALFICGSIEVVAQNTTWVLPFKPNATSNNVVVNDVEVDASNNIYVTGAFKGTVNFNYNGTASNLTSAGGYDIFVAKYNTSGALQWVKKIGGTADDVSIAIAIQGTAVVIAGTFESTSVDFDPGAGTNSLSSSGMTDLFVAKFDASGNYTWAFRSGGTQGELMSDVELDGNGNVFLAGSFTALNDFFSNTNTSTYGARDGFICKLSSTGTFQWVKVIGGAGTDICNKISIAGSNLLLCADIGSGSTSFDPGSGTSNQTFSGAGTNGIAIHYNASTGSFSGFYQFKGNTSALKYVTTGSHNFIIGTFTGANLDADPGAGVVDVDAVGARDMFIIQMSSISGGTYMKHIIANGISGGQVFVNNVGLKRYASSGDLDIYITGYAKGQVNFGGTSAYDTDGPGGGSTNDYSYLAKYNNRTATFSYDYAYENAISGTNTGVSRGLGVTVESTGNAIVGGFYSSNNVPPAPAVFNPGGLTGTTGSFADPGYGSTYMGYLQYVNGCTMPTTTAVANDYSVCSGTSVTLTGSGATTYSWNTGSTATSLTVTPTTTTTYTLTGTNTGGCVKTDTVKVTVTASPNTVAAAAQYYVCNGSSITLNGSGATTYSWNTGSTAASVSVTPVATTTYTLTGTSNGCSKTDTVKITLRPLPATTASTTTYSICNGSSTNLSASGANTYSWNTGSTSGTISVSPTTTTTYTLTGTLNGCSKSDTVKITVKSLPSTVASATNYSPCIGSSTTLNASGATTYSWNTGSTNTTVGINTVVTTTYTLTGTSNGCTKTDTVKITPRALPNTVGVANDYSLCDNQSATLTASGATTYSWSSGSTASTFTITPNSTTTYTVTGTTNGCSKTDTVKLTVNSFTLSVSPASASICSGSGNNAVFTASGANTYSWTGGPATASYTVMPATTTTYTVTATSAAGCTKTTTAVVTVSNAAVINVTPASPTICAGGNGTTLTASGANSYTWTGGPATATYTVNPTITTTYTVTGTATGGCTGNTTVTVNVANLPNVSASAQDLAICEGSGTTLSASGASTYSWNTGSTGSNTMVVPVSTTTYTVEGTSVDGCVNTATVSVVVNAMPVITVTANDPELIADEIGATYQWINCGNNLPIQGETAQSYTASANGDYKVAVSKNGCSDTSACINISTTEMGSNYSLLNEISIAPNPASDAVLFHSNDAGNYLMQMIDISGKVVLEKQINDQNERVSVSDLCNGIYYVKIIGSEKTLTVKLVISK